MSEYVFKEEFLEENKEVKENLTYIPKSKQNKLENAVKLMFVQSAVCLVLVLSVFILSFAAPAQYKLFKEGYKNAVTQSDVTFSDIKNLLSQIKEFVFAPNKPKGAGGDDSIIPSNVSTNAYVLTSPISSPVKEGTVTSPFGPRVHPIFKTDGFHTGLDIASKLGTPITAAFSGTIYECGKSEAYGNYIIMRHSDTLFTFYGHCNSLKAQEGMQIRRGEIIAYMGSTGYSTGPHLHFEIRIDGKRVDPAYVLKGNKNIEF